MEEVLFSFRPLSEEGYRHMDGGKMFLLDSTGISHARTAKDAMLKLTMALQDKQNVMEHQIIYRTPLGQLNLDLTRYKPERSNSLEDRTALVADILACGGSLEQVERAMRNMNLVNESGYLHHKGHGVPIMPYTGMFVPSDKSQYGILEEMVKDPAQNAYVSSVLEATNSVRVEATLYPVNADAFKDLAVVMYDPDRETESAHERRAKSIVEPGERPVFPVFMRVILHDVYKDGTPVILENSGNLNESVNEWDDDATEYEPHLAYTGFWPHNLPVGKTELFLPTALEAFGNVEVQFVKTDDLAGFISGDRRQGYLKELQE